MQYPWETTGLVIANIEQVTIDDAVNSLSWRNHDKYPEYNFYNIYPESGVTNNPITSSCRNLSASCDIVLTLQITPQSLVNEVRQSNHGLKKWDMILNEGAIVGGVSLVTFFLSMYVLK